MNSKQTNCSSHQKVLIFLALFAIIIISLIWFNFRTTPSPYTSAPSEQFVCSSLQTQYPLDADRITISVSNIGDYSGEFEKPYLEVLKGNTWYKVENALQEDVTSNLLYLSPGDSGTFDMFLSQYETDLTSGHYRAVFAFYQGSDFFSFEFDLTEDSV